MLRDLFTETWKELECGANEKNHPFRVCTLATFENSEAIKQRMVNLRKITSRRTLLFYSDSRSSKIGQIENNPLGSVVFYNPASQLQIFLRGSISIHTRDEIWQDHMLKIDGRAVNDYNTMSPPGKKIKNPISVRRTENLNFAVLELIPDTIEYLKLRAEPNRLRAVFNKTEDNWEMTFLVP